MENQFFKISFSLSTEFFLSFLLFFIWINFAQLISTKFNFYGLFATVDCNQTRNFVLLDLVELKLIYFSNLFANSPQNTDLYKKNL